MSRTTTIDVMRVIDRFVSERASRGDDARGLTLVELLISVVVAGFITGIIAQVLILGIQLGPQVSDRTGFAAQASLLVNSLSDDVANATGVTTTSDFGTCTSNATFNLATVAGTDGSTHTYTGTVDAAPAGMVNGTTYSLKVTITRDGTPGVVGYCTILNGTGSPLGSASYDGTVRYTLALTLFGSTGGTDARQIKFEADRRAP